MPPPILTLARETNRSCSTCGSLLTMTGKAAEFIEVKPAPRRHGWKGFVPSLLITICPVCDTRAEQPSDVTELPDDGQPT